MLPAAASTTSPIGPSLGWHSSRRRRQCRVPFIFPLTLTSGFPPAMPPAPAPYRWRRRPVLSAIRQERNHFVVRMRPHLLSLPQARNPTTCVLPLTPPTMPCPLSSRSL